MSRGSQAQKRLFVENPKREIGSPAQRLGNGVCGSNNKKESNSQKGSEGAQVPNLLNFPSFCGDFSLVVYDCFFAFG